MTLVYPDLIGVSIELGMTPEFDNKIASHSSGSETVTSYREFPQWLFELSYEYLPHSVIKPHLEQIQGLFLSARGNFSLFQFRCPEHDLSENVVLGQGDGATTQFTLVRNTGGFIEPIGTIDTDFPVEITLNGVLSDPGDYTVTGNKVVFDTAPANGAVIHGTFKYLFMCRFEESSLRFDRFMKNLWELKSVEIRAIPQ